MHQAHLTCLISGAFAGLLDVRRMLGEHIVSDCGVCSQALLRVCLLIHLSVCLPSRHLTPCTYHRSLSPLVDSSPGALAAASLLNW